MAGKKISAAELPGAMAELLEDYSGEVLLATRRAVDQTADEVVSKTQAGVSAKGLIRTGAYRESWTSEVDSNANRLAYSRTVYNADHYRLTHLLQNGHGGPHPAPAYPHIVEDDESSKILEENFKRELGV